MSSEVVVKPQYTEEEYEERVTEVVEVPKVDKELEKLRKEREELMKKLGELNSRIADLMRRKTKVKVIKKKRKVALMECPKCGARIKLVVKDKFTGRVRCRCGTILKAV